MELVKEYWQLLLPLFLLQLTLMVIGLIDLFRRDRQTRGPKWVWAIVIVLGELLGPIVYFAAGRKD